MIIAGSFFIPQESLFYCKKKLHSTNIAETLTCLYVSPIWQSLPDVVPLKPIALRTTTEAKVCRMAIYALKRWLTTVCNPKTLFFFFFTLVLLCTGTISTYPRVWDFETPK